MHLCCFFFSKNTLLVCKFFCQKLGRVNFLTNIKSGLRLLTQTTIMDNKWTKWTTKVILFVILKVCNITMHVQMGNINMIKYTS